MDKKDDGHDKNRSSGGPRPSQSTSVSQGTKDHLNGELVYFVIEGVRFLSVPDSGPESTTARVHGPPGPSPYRSRVSRDNDTQDGSDRFQRRNY